MAHLDGVLVGEEVDDLEGVGDDADGQELLAVVATLHHERVDQALNDGHLSLLELLLGVAAGGVGEVDSMADLDVVGQGDVLDFDTVPRSIRPMCAELRNSLLGVPLAKKLDLAAEF